MEKSIELIWKEGFLQNDALVAPKINRLYSQKSIHIIDQFKRMFRINLIAIVAFSTLFLIASYFIGIPVMGTIFFVTLMVLVIINQRLLRNLGKIDKGNSSYTYLKSFKHWMDQQIEVNKRLSTLLYPIFFMAFVLGFWFKDAEGLPLGERLVAKLLTSFPEMTLVYGVPLTGILIAVFVVGLLAYFGGRIYQWDLNIGYGNVIKKLDELIADIEDLNS
jgi:hypothetical protein